MSSYTPPQARLLQHMQETGQMINVDSQGRPFLMDGTQVNRLTLKALVKKEVLIPCGSDLFDQVVSVYAISNEVAA